MPDPSLVEAKEKVVEDMAARLGVERYLPTPRTEQVRAIIAEWSIESEDMDQMAQESLWLDAKEEIENILTDLALTHNAKHELQLLGATNAGMISMDEVRAGFVTAWNKLLMQYRTGIANQQPRNLVDMDRQRDKVLSQIPLYGTVEDKQNAVAMATSAVANLEGTLKNMAEAADGRALKAAIAERETTRSMVLAQAEAAKRNSEMPHGNYKQIQMLIGRQANSLLEGQLLSLKNFPAKPDLVIEQIDRTLAQAQTLIANQQEQAGWMEQLISPPGLLGTGNTGDGIRAPYSLNLVGNPVVLGPGALPGNEGEPTWTAKPVHTINKSPTILNNTGNPAEQYWVTNTPQQPSSPYRNNQVANKALFGSHKARNEGLYGDGFGGTIGDYVDEHPMLSLLGALGFIWILTSGGNKAFSSYLGWKPKPSNQGATSVFDRFKD